MKKIRLKLFLLFLPLSLLIPVFELPDEQGHFAMVQFLAEEKRIPKGEELDLSYELKTTEDLLGTFRDELGNNLYTYHPEYKPEYTGNVIGKYENQITELNTSENRTNYVWTEAARYPFLYYTYGSIWYYLGDSGSLIDRLFLVRLGTIILSALTVGTSYLLGKELFNKNKYALTLALIMAFHPMLSFIGTGVNSDNLHNLLFTAAIYILSRLINHGWEKGSIFKLATVVALDVFTKPQAYILLPVILLAVGIRAYKDKMFKLHLLNLLKLGGLIVIIAGWHEWPKLSTALLSGSLPYTDFTRPAPTTTPEFIPFLKFSLNKLYAQNLVWYWGVYKWLGVVLPRPFWWSANRIVILSVFGIALSFYRNFKKKLKPLISSHQLLFLLFLSVIYAGSIFFYDWTFSQRVGYSLGVQARYYYPTISAHMAILLTGILSLFSDAKTREILRKGLVLFFLALQLAGIYTIASSYYDLSSISTFITQASQYKPWFAKGHWWYLWILLYIFSVLKLLSTIKDNEKTT